MINRTHQISASLLLLACLTVPARSARADSGTATFALVVSNNRSLDASQSALRYADDDGARFYELMRALGARVELLSVLDAQTQKTFPGLAAASKPPSSAQLRASVTRLRAAIGAANRAGKKTVLYFYYAGHGGVGKDHEGYVNLLDRRFTRSDLYREVIARSPATTNHIIIDACNAYYLVGRRGGHGAGSRAPRFRAAIRSFLARESLSRYPNTGVVLSTTTKAESHEWSRYRSGIFSHQLLSALWGSADVDGNHRVDYDELRAYVAAANLRVRDSRARLSIFARAPRSNLTAPLVDLARLERVARGARRRSNGAVAGFLTIGRQLSGHYYLEDDRGLRYVDFNKTGDYALRIALLDRPYYYLRSRYSEALIKLDTPRDVDAASLRSAPIATRSRGSVERSFRNDLYAFPFGPSFAVGHAAAAAHQTDAPAAFDATVADAASARPWYSRARTWKWVAAGVAAGGLALGVTMQLLAASTARELRDGGTLSMQQAIDLQARSNTQQSIAGVAFGIAGSAAVTSLVLFLVDRGAARPRSPQVVQLAPRPGGATATFATSF